MGHMFTGVVSGWKPNMVRRTIVKGVKNETEGTQWSGLQRG